MSRHVVVVGAPMTLTTADHVSRVMAGLGVWRVLTCDGFRVTRVLAAGNQETAERIAGLSTDRLRLMPLVPRLREPRALAHYASMERHLALLEPDIVHCIGEPWQLGIISA